MKAFAALRKEYPCGEFHALFGPGAAAGLLDLNRRVMPTRNRMRSTCDRLHGRRGDGSKDVFEPAVWISIRRPADSQAPFVATYYKERMNQK